MSHVVRAVFEHGTFIPESPCDLPEGTKVLLTVCPAGTVRQPEVTDPGERARILREVVARMNANPLPENAPRFSRDEMHERR
jgi:predicted DNA-binding antitoxin AbrB/MazE fold protein